MEIFYIEVYTVMEDTVGFLVIADNEDEAVNKIANAGIRIQETFYEMKAVDMINEHGEDGVLRLSDTIGF